MSLFKHISAPIRTWSVRAVLPIFSLVLPAALIAGAHGQALPVAVTPTPAEGFQIPVINGSLRYSISAGESLIFGYNGEPGTGTNAFTNLSGDLAYLSKSEEHPFTAVYSGGYLFGSSNEPSYPFQNLLLSQSVRTGRWTYTLSDSVAYLPQTPETGLSGVPGVGDLNVIPSSTVIPSGLGILTNYETRVSNAVSGTVARNLTGSTTLSGTGSFSIQRFTGNGTQGIDSNQTIGTGAISHRINARNTIGADYDFSSSSFSGGQYGFQTQGVNLDYTRQWTRKFSTVFTVGPQRVSGSSATLSNPSTNVAVNASGLYTGRAFTAAVNYSRGINNGSGVLIGSRSDAVNVSVNRRLGRAWFTSGQVGYNRSSSLPSLILPSFSNNGVVASAQVSRALARYLSLFASYTVQRQSTQGFAVAGNAFNGLSQVLGFGVTYSPRPFLGR